MLSTAHHPSYLPQPDVPPTANADAVPNKEEGGGRMRMNTKTSQWRYLLYMGATLTTFLLAAGAKWKNH
jgi:hypothetical protein